ncbi:hypothetical protein LR48_Vigan02g041000 [Vigna angularis]|nr:uncharacterized protein LOC108325751 [Vigna angularis]KOM34260.1 hypothetical protein LR48_Vigan02g041000 [Vigna angularis]
MTKDAATLQYLTTLSYNTPLVPTKLVLDLGGSFLWLHCATRNTLSSSSLTTPHRTLQCFVAKTHKSPNFFLFGPIDQHHYQPFQVFSKNSITDPVAYEFEILKSLTFTQLVTGFPSLNYFINVSSAKINDKGCPWTPQSSTSKRGLQVGSSMPVIELVM